MSQEVFYPAKSTRDSTLYLCFDIPGQDKPLCISYGFAGLGQNDLTLHLLLLNNNLHILWLTSDPTDPVLYIHHLYIVTLQINLKKIILETCKRFIDREDYYVNISSSYFHHGNGSIGVPFTPSHRKNIIKSH